jgi:hypothetical protein
MLEVSFLGGSVGVTRTFDFAAIEETITPARPLFIHCATVSVLEHLNMAHFVEPNDQAMLRL